jgi:hypothetical protein
VLLGLLLEEPALPLGLAEPDGERTPESLLGEVMLELSVTPAPLSLGAPVGEVVCPAWVESPDRRPSMPLVSRVLSAPSRTVSLAPTCPGRESVSTPPVPVYPAVSGRS